MSLAVLFICSNFIVLLLSFFLSKQMMMMTSKYGNKLVMTPVDALHA